MEIYISIFFIFVLGLGMAAANANVTLQRSTNTALLAQLRDLEVQNTQIEADIVETRNLEEVEHIARTRLGMSQPLPHQIVQVDIMPEAEQMAVDLTAPPVYEKTLAERTSEFFSNIVEFFADRGE